MSEWLAVTKVTEIPPLGSRVVEAKTMKIALFRNNQDQVFAIKDACPHKQGPLSQGIMHNNTVTCPLHNWRINLETGQALEPDEGCAHIFEVKIEQGLVYLKKSALNNTD